MVCTCMRRLFSYVLVGVCESVFSGWLGLLGVCVLMSAVTRLLAVCVYFFVIFGIFVFGIFGIF